MDRPLDDRCLDPAEVGEEEMSRHRLRQHPASDSNVMSPKPRVVIVVRVQYTLVAHEQLTKRDDDSAPMAQPDG